MRASQQAIGQDWKDRREGLPNPNLCRGLMQIQFLTGISGYIWVFPRMDHVSAGITAKMGEMATSELRRMLEQWLDENGFQLENARFYSHILPALRPA